MNQKAPENIPPRIIEMFLILTSTQYFYNSLTHKHTILHSALYHIPLVINVLCTCTMYIQYILSAHLWFHWMFLFCYCNLFPNINKCTYGALFVYVFTFQLYVIFGYFFFIPFAGIISAILKHKPNTIYQNVYIIPFCVNNQFKIRGTYAIYI